MEHKKIDIDNILDLTKKVEEMFHYTNWSRNSLFKKVTIFHVGNNTPYSRSYTYPELRG